MGKEIRDLTVRSIQKVGSRFVHIRLGSNEPLPQMVPGQFVQVRVDGSPSTFLRRPISINFVDYESNELWLLVAVVGDGTRRLAQLQEGDSLNCVLPLGKGFSLPQPLQKKGGRNTPKVLLVGGGVGIAPLLYQGYTLNQRLKDAEVTFLLGGRSSSDLVLLDEFAKYGRVLTTTEDGSLGTKGFVTNHPALAAERFDLIQCCGPTPMMKAVVSYAWKKDIACQASLENLMACGLGACLCCVEKIASPIPSEGREPVVRNVCVCKDGPVFNKEELTWQS